MPEEPIAEVKTFSPFLTRLPSMMLSALAKLSQVIKSKGSMTLIDQGVSSATNFLTGVIIGRICTKEEFGLYMIGFTIVIFLMNFQSSLILGAYSVYSPRLEGTEQTLYTGSTLIHQLAFSVLAIIFMGLGAGAVLLGYGPKGIETISWTLVWVSAFILLREYVRQVSFAHLEMQAALILDSAVAIIQVGGLLLLVYLGFLSTARAFEVIGVACGLAALAWLILKRRRFALQRSRVGSDFKRNWSFSKWLVADRMVYLSANQLYPFILVYFHGTAATGVLAACSGVIYLANPLLIGIGNFLGPKNAHAFARGGKNEVRRSVVRDTIAIAAILLPFCIVMLIFGGKILGLMYGAKYADNGIVVGVLALGQFSLALTIPIMCGLNAIERPDAGFTASLLAFFIMLFLGLWVVKLFGPIGVGLALLAGNLVISTYRWVIFNRECPANS
jgi:O-antigen/teichoic acid export membrane protein